MRSHRGILIDAHDTPWMRGYIYMPLERPVSDTAPDWSFSPAIPDGIPQSENRRVSQVFSIIPANTAPEDALRQFLDLWQSVGAYVPATHGYRLTSGSGEVALVTLEKDELLFQGVFDEAGIALLASFAEGLNAELLLEGEPLRADRESPPWRKLGPVGKTLSILGGLILLPLAVALLPLLVVIGIARLLFTLMKPSGERT